MSEILQNLHGGLLSSGLRVSSAESCTSGLIGAALTDLSGSSAYYLGGINCYSNEAKVKFAGVDSSDLEANGAVSEVVAKQLAAGVMAGFGADLAVSTTGIAGPGGGSEEKPVGTVWIGWSGKNLAYNGSTNGAKCFRFDGDRAEVRKQAVVAALQILAEMVKES